MQKTIFPAFSVPSLFPSFEWTQPNVLKSLSRDPVDSEQAKIFRQIFDISSGTLGSFTYSEQTPLGSGEFGSVGLSGGSTFARMPGVEGSNPAGVYCFFYLNQKTVFKSLI